MRKTNPLHLLKFGLQRTAGPYSWVKLGKAPCEHMFSAVHPTTDIAKILRDVRFVPKAVIQHDIAKCGTRDRAVTLRGQPCVILH